MSDYAWPTKSREYVRWIFDSTRWNDFKVRDDDVIIATYSKSGTTWMQQIVGQLVFQGDPDLYGDAYSPFVESRIHPDPIGLANAQTHRRFLKTHLPLDALPYAPQARYIYVGRDGRDVFWSWHNHFSHMRPEVLARINALQSPGTPETTHPDPDIRAAFHQWLDSDGMPNSSFWSHAAGWWTVRDAPNMLVTHYARLKSDLPGEVDRIARFLGIAIDPDVRPAILANCSFEHMRKLASRHPVLDRIFVGGGETFINKGTNGRWRDVLTKEDLDKYRSEAARRLAPECAHWLETAQMPDA